MLVAAVQRVLDKLVAVLEQIGVELSARARQIVECVQVELAGELSDDAVWHTWLAYPRGMERVLAVGSGSRVTAEGCREPVDVWIRSLASCFCIATRC